MSKRGGKAGELSGLKEEQKAEEDILNAEVGSQEEEEVARLQGQVKEQDEQSSLLARASQWIEGRRGD